MEFIISLPEYLCSADGMAGVAPRSHDSRSPAVGSVRDASLSPGWPEVKVVSRAGMGQVLRGELITGRTKLEPVVVRRWGALLGTEMAGTVMQNGQVHDLSGDVQHHTGTQNNYSQERKGTTQRRRRFNRHWGMLPRAGVCRCAQVRALSVGSPPPGPAVPLAGHPSLSTLAQHHHSHLGAQYKPVSPLPTRRPVRTAVREQLLPIRRTSRAAAPPGDRHRNDRPRAPASPREALGPHSPVPTSLPSRLLFSFSVCSISRVS